jgi:hypothetical protein
VTATSNFNENDKVILDEDGVIALFTSTGDATDCPVWRYELFMSNGMIINAYMEEFKLLKITERLDTIPILWDTGYVPLDGNMNSVVSFTLTAFNYAPFLIAADSGCPSAERGDHIITSDTSTGYSLMGCNNWCVTHTFSADVCKYFEWSSTYATFAFG